MVKVALVRGAYLNNFEGQNYVFKSDQVSLTAIGSKHTLHQILPFSSVRLWSPTDIKIPKPVGNRLIGDTQYLLGLEKYASDFDIFHTADPHYFYSYQLAKLRSQNKIKCLISTSWETIPFNNETIAKKKYIKRFTMKYVDHFICYTERARRCLMVEGIDQHCISVIKLGVNLQTFKPKRKRNKKMHILFAGRSVEEKGYADLMKAIEGLKDLNVVTADNIPYGQMPEYYNKGDILVVPSKSNLTWEEQYGMVLVEGMACGLPIVAYRSGAIPEVVGNVGRLVKEGDVKSLGRALAQLTTSRSVRAKLGTMARRRAVIYFDRRKTAREIEKIYIKVLKKL